MDPAELERQRNNKMCMKSIFCCLSVLVTGSCGRSSRSSRRKRARKAAAVSVYGAPGHIRFDDKDDLGFNFSPPRAMPTQKAVGNVKYMT